MPNDYFQFKQFIIRQERTAMKVGTDGVLLGAWADIENASTILDIGTGTGLIALMAAQRNPEAVIDAIEIIPGACRQAQENIDNSPWANRITLYNLSIFDFYTEKTYDRIVCNPPFFIGSTPAPNADRTTARHCNHFSHTELLKAVSNLLSENGKFCLILPPTEALLLIDHAKENGFSVERITQVLPNPGKAPKRYLITVGKQAIETKTNILVLELKRHQLSEECIRLTKEFYLKL